LHKYGHSAITLTVKVYMLMPRTSFRHV